MLLSSVLSFWLEKLPLAVLVRQVWCHWTPSAFIYPRNSLFCLHFWKVVFQIEYLGQLWVFSFILALWEYYSIWFWTLSFLLRNLLIILWELPFVWWVAFLCFPSRFYFLCFWLLTVWLSCASVWASLGLSFGISWDSWIQMLIFGKFSTIISSKILSPFLLDSQKEWESRMCILVLLMVSHKLLRFYSLFFIFFLLLF